MTTIDPIDIQALFARAKKEYNQSAQTFYVSSKNLDSLHFAVLPHLNEYIFSFFNFGDDDDVEALNNMWHTQKIFKTFGCTLCPIQNEDNAVVISDTQNQLYLDPKTPSVQVQTYWKSQYGNSYIITATVPQYYYNHLLFVSADHIPSYGIFINEVLFNDLFEYLSIVYSSDQKVTAIFNGSFGSDIFHFHVHLTDQQLSVIELLWGALQEKMSAGGLPSLYYSEIDLQVVHGIVFTSTDINELYRHAQKIALSYHIFNNIKNRALSANFSVRPLTDQSGSEQTIYMIFFQWINLKSNKPGAQRTVRKINNCNYFLIPSGYIINANCFNINPQDYDQFEAELSAAFDDVYVPFDINQVNRILEDDSIVNNFATGTISTAQDLAQMPVEEVYAIINPYFNEYKYQNQPLASEMVNRINNAILSILGTGANCFLTDCRWEYNAKFKYLLGVNIALLSPDDLKVALQDPSLEDVRISASIKYLYNYNGSKYDMIQSDYLYFKGTFLAGLLRKTFKNLILSTGSVDDQRPSINKWLNFIFNRIGEYSASGVNTVSKLAQAPTVDFVMKIMPLADPYTYQNNGTIINNRAKESEFKHEYLTSLQVNDLRQYVPNYILCYGGFQCGNDAQFSCNSHGICYLTNVKELCTAPSKMPLSYILLENIKNSKTVARHIKLPNLTYSGEAADYTDMMLQIFIALVYGWNLKKFTHYDLHLNNVMVYDFVSNPNYLKLFKIWDEYEGSKIPKIEGIYFAYYLTSDSYPIIIPAKYLYLIIDYGSAYVNGLTSYHTFPRRVESIGMTSDRPKSVADVYTFNMSLLLHIMLYKPYLIFDELNNTWLDNKLSKVFKKVFRAYKNLYKNMPKIIRMLPRISALTEHNRHNLFVDYLTNEIKPEYAVGHFQYLHKDFDATMVDSNFNSPGKVVDWIYRNLYNYGDLFSKLSDPDAYIFNWGGPLLPEGVLQGIQPNKSIQKLIANRKEKQSQDISRVRAFTQQL